MLLLLKENKETDKQTCTALSQQGLLSTVNAGKPQKILWVWL